MRRIVTGLAIVTGMLIGEGLQAQTVLTADSDTLCAGDSTQIVATGNTSYAWSPSTGLNQATGGTVWANPGSSTTYMVIGTTGMTSDTAYITITVNGIPTISASSSEDTVCAGTSVEFYAMGADTYAWTGATSTNSSGDTATASPNSSGNITVTGTDTNGCSADDMVYVEVNANPSVTISAPTWICENTPTAISASGALTYNWTNPVGAFNPTSGANTSVTLATASSVSVTGTDANGCEGTASRTLLVNSIPPQISVVTNDSIVCAGDSVELNGVGTSADSYNWKDLTGNSLLGSAGQTVYATPNTTSTYEVVSEKNGCKDSAQYVVTVNPIPSISLSQSSNGSPICKDEADTITVTSNGILFLWHLPGSNVTTTGTVKAVTPGVTSSIEVEAISDQGCKNAAFITINVDTSCGENLGLTELLNHLQVAYDQNNSEFSVSGLDGANVIGLSLINLNSQLVASSEEFKLTTGGLEGGVYILRVEWNGGVATRKFLIE